MLAILCWVFAAGAAGVAEADSPGPDQVCKRQPSNELRENLADLTRADWIDQDRWYPVHQARLRALRERTGQAVRPEKITTAQDASGGCDGVKNGLWGFHVASGEQDPWWQVDLGRSYRLDRVVVFNRTDSGRCSQTMKLRLLVADAPDAPSFREVYRHDGKPFGGVYGGGPLVVKLAKKGVKARIVRLAIDGRCSFGLDEIEVYGVDDPKKNLALGRPADQKSVSPFSWPGTMPDSKTGPWRRHLPREAKKDASGKPAEDAAFPSEHTREILERGLRLADRLAGRVDAAKLEPLRTELKRLAVLAKEIKPRSAKEERAARRGLYLDARRVVRQVAWLNPALDIDRLLLIKRHDAKGVFHMCDQYYGFNAVPGGGLFILEDPFGPTPRLVDLLADAVVQRGRLKGRKLTGGSVVSPELSFDGKTILFAWSQACGKNLEWTPESCYHIFKINADGTGLEQLTDGPWDDFDPCFLPNGRIAFISLRRGGYLRCGRHCPTYTMHSMAADGSDIICLSYHETHEWHPSVGNDGMIVYTRWDYVDRDTNVAHHIWTCYPDGRDPRSFHGNYPIHREDRPWMEMSIRAIPNSPLFVATAAAHHGHAFGSLVLIDPRLPDDRAMSQLTRLTPEVPFPEAEGGKRKIRDYMVYATPWPLSEQDYLCAYDPAAKNHGVYWIDADGNRELIYRDPSIACLSPIPLRARPMPPVIPTRTTQAAEDREAGPPRQATIAVTNVYDSDFEWPEGSRVTALRIIQALPKTTAPPNKPRIGVAEQTNARAVLGTVPVEPDGSVYFKAPVGKAIYFQALDEQGLAIQSMRSATYVHPGEQLTCQGCHERKRRSQAPPTTGTPLAMTRPPSKIKPDVPGTNPFSYVRLVQPVLDKHCVSCHQEREVLDLTGAIEDKYGWTRSYHNLAGQYGFYFHVRNGSIKTGVHGGSRTVPGAFGARAAKLMDYLDQDHYGVKLSAEERRRITVWLDCNSEFYGSYEKTEAQARGEVVWPSLN